MTPKIDRELASGGSLPMNLIVVEATAFSCHSFPVLTEWQKTSESPAWLNPEINAWIDKSRVF
jgi:hypothetical protein